MALASPIDEAEAIVSEENILKFGKYRKYRDLGVTRRRHN